ncbi:hypothetical protein MBLNU230_g4269t1 [Neophaeotheca triangularis]
MSAPFKVKGVYEYTSAEEDDLNFTEGQIVTVTEVVDDDWYMGEYVDSSGSKQEGMFPKNFVEKYEPPVPSRPTRVPKAKQEVVSSPPVEQPRQPEPEPQPQPQPEREPEPTRESEPEPQPAQNAVEDAPAVPAASKPQVPSVDTSRAASMQQEELRSPQSASSAKSPSARAEPPAPKPAQAPAEAAGSGAKGPPPPVSEKPSSFRDRIAAFNKPAAAPIAPFKPGGGGQPNFIKKPFVAPPPSKDAYVPQPKNEPVHKPYVRDEDPEIRQRQEEDRAAAEAAGFSNDAPSSPQPAEGEESQQPQSLKERIALLQQQQREQAQRRAEGGTKEKPKKPVKKPSESSERPVPAPEMENEEQQEQDYTETHDRKSMDVPRERPRIPSAQKPPQEPMSPPRYVAEHDTISDGNEADLSAAGETTDDTGTIGPGDSDDTQIMEPAVPAQRAPAAPTREPDGGNQEDTAEDDEEDEEEEEEDDETRRKRELRERMAKMSGGMGMGAMFGPPGGMPMAGGAPPKKKSSTRDASSSSKAPPPAPEDAPTSPSEHYQRAPMVPVPGMGGRVQSPDSQHPPEVQKEEDDEGLVTGTREPETMPDMEDVKPTAPPRTSTSGSSGMAPPVPFDRRPSQAPSERGAPPPIPGDRPVPRPPPAESRPVPPPPPAAGPLSPGPGSESDDEMSMHAKRSSAETQGVETPLPMRSGAPSIPTSREVPPRPSSDARQSGYFAASESAPSNSEKRQSRAVPPVPGPASPHSPRPPPPPPPGAAPTRHSTDLQAPPPEDERGESDYEGDYDTDIASSAKHKDALKSHAREPSGDSTTADETPVTSPSQTQPPPIPGQSRAVPPPPPQAAPKSRQSMDTPRAPPPMPPTREVPPTEEEDDYDPYRYNENARSVPPPPSQAAPVPVPPMPSREPQEVQGESSDDMYSASPPRKSVDRPPPPPPQAAPREPAPPMPQMQAPLPQQPSRGSNRQSLDVSRQPNVGRRSMEAGRPTGEHGQIATDLDLALPTQWWTAQNPLPPALAPRNGIDILSESEESTTSKRGGRTTISKDIYVLFLDYSQTIITARYDSRDASDATLEQRHEPPPPRLRQDQLEDYWQRYGAQLAAQTSKLATEGKKDTVIGDGRPHSLVLSLLANHPNALQPVGTRAYGALVYANLANASVQQFDEIRAGDVVTLRNAKFEGKAGAMHQKYKAEVGMTAGSTGATGHVAVVEEWDGTRKKVRVWEQGREKGRLRGESYRLGDLRSGEVRVWRVVGRERVGWDGGA